MQSSIINIVSAQPARMQWHHRAYIGAISSLWIAIALFEVYLLISGGLANAMRFEILGLLAMSSALWFRSVYPMISNKPVLKYDQQKILYFRSSHTELDAPIPFGKLKHAIRKSPTSIEIELTESVAFTNPLSADYDRHVVSRNFNVQGNEKDLDDLSRALLSRDIAVTDSPIPDDDPLKSAVVLFTSLGFLFAGILGLIFLL
ncbi:hypothetical protein EON64_00040, partial [archaeon]